MSGLSFGTCVPSTHSLLYDPDQTYLEGISSKIILRQDTLQSPQLNDGPV